MLKLGPEGIGVAVVAHPKNPVGYGGGTEVFAGLVSNYLADQGFEVVVYGQSPPKYKFVDKVQYVSSGPSTGSIQSTDGVSSRRAITEAAVFPGLKLAQDLERRQTEDNPKRWIVIDNDVTTVPLAPSFAHMGIVHLFVQHAFMTKNLAEIYNGVRTSGSKIIAIADFQRKETENRGLLRYDATIKNGVVIDSASYEIPSFEGGIRVGTLSRIEPEDTKGILFAKMAVERLREAGQPVTLYVAGANAAHEFYDQVLSPGVTSGSIRYVGHVTENRSRYLNDLHVGLALSNPGRWDGNKEFQGNFQEGRSIMLDEMIGYGIIPVSTDSGGAEPLRDAHFEEFIVPISIIREQGISIFIGIVAEKILKAANTGLTRREIGGRARTVKQMGDEYVTYILDLVNGESSTPTIIATVPTTKVGNDTAFPRHVESNPNKLESDHELAPEGFPNLINAYDAMKKQIVAKAIYYYTNSLMGKDSGSALARGMYIAKCCQFFDLDPSLLWETLKEAMESDIQLRDRLTSKTNSVLFGHSRPYKPVEYIDIRKRDKSLSEMQNSFLWAKELMVLDKTDFDRISMRYNMVVDLSPEKFDESVLVLVDDVRNIIRSKKESETAQKEQVFPI